jgi:hypothetical protein
MSKDAYEKSYWIRDRQGKKVGYCLAYTHWASDHDKVAIGFSFCDTRYDSFNRTLAMDLADSRADHLMLAKNLDSVMKKIPYKYRVDFCWFVEACTRYFKDREFPAWVYELENRGFMYYD